MKTRPTAAFLTVLAAVLAAPAAPAQAPADRIWTGGPILTMNDAAMRAEAVAEQGGRIVAVGTAAEVMKLKGAGTKVIDLGGRAMLPGFVDAHGHVMLGGIQALSANLLAPPDGTVTDIASLQRLLREWMAANAAAVQKTGLVLGFGYDNATLAEHRHPTRDDLDAVSKEIPILLVHQSGHLLAVNSKAIEIVGTTAETPDPQGGVIRRRPGSREPDGVYEETAAGPVLVKLLGRGGGRRGQDLRPRRRRAVGAFRLHHRRRGALDPGDGPDPAPGGRRGRLHDRRRDLPRRPDRPRVHQAEPQPDLQEPPPRRRRQADDRRLAAGVHRLARPALLRPGGRLPARLRRTTLRRRASRSSTRSTGPSPTTFRSWSTPTARPPRTC